MPQCRGISGQGSRRGVDWGTVGGEMGYGIFRGGPGKETTSEM